MLVALFDLDSTLFSTCFSCSSRNLDDPGEVKSCADGYLDTILRNLNTNFFIGFLYGGGNFRKKLYSGYKANRVDSVLPPYFEDLREYLISEYLAVLVYGAEVDDAISIVHKRNSNTVICSPDKDFRQIPGEIYDTFKHKRTTITEEEANYNLWKQVLTGDSGDRIPGLEGTGKVKAARVLENSQNYEESVQEAYKNKYAGIDEFNLNYRLIKLLDEGLPLIRVRKAVYE